MGARSSQSRGPGLNKTDGHLIEYYRKFFGAGGGGTNAPIPESPSGLTATGGIISDYTDGPAIYRAHIFTSSGTFDVTEIGSFPSDVEYLVVAGGGGGGGYAYGGGGGAGGFRTNLSGHPLAGSTFPVSVSPYPVSVGAGGAGAPGATGVMGTSGSVSTFSTVTSQGGGYGGSFKNNPGDSGGSGGGGGAGLPNSPAGAGGDGNKVTGTTTPAPTQGNPGFGAGAPGVIGGGGGGAAAAATDINGGAGSPIAIESTTAKTYAGGGGGGQGNPGPAVGGTGGAGGGGTAGTSATDIHGTYSTGGGGAGGGFPGAPAPGVIDYGGRGGSGIVVVRYQIGSTDTAKASGGAISFYNGKTIHVYTSSSDFVTPATFNETVEYVVIGGGGAGAVNISGGGGAGAYRTGTTPVTGPQTITVQVGAGGVSPVAGSNGDDGTPSFFGTPITAPGGGGGGYYGGVGNNSPGGSGGGGGTAAVVYSPPGAAALAGGSGGTYGNPGGAGWGGNAAGGGGGGAGGPGGNAENPYPNNVDNGSAGAGGDGIRIPTTFHDPRSAPPSATPGPNVGGGIGTPGPAGGFYVAGGGAGGTLKGDATGYYAGAAGGYGGGGSSADPFAPLAYGMQGVENTGSGGAATNVGPPSGTASYRGGNGGSGLVLVAYPT